jgi:sugar/nucleoside kinase (ribokinase family)
VLKELRDAAPETKVALDTVNPPDTWERLVPILSYVDTFCPSRTEAASLSGETTPHKMVAKFREHMKPHALVGIKLDADGCYLDDGQKAVTVPAYKITVVDTTGAGDTWFGGLLTGLIRDMPLEQAGQFANRAAADCCTELGASMGVKNFEQTISRL